MKWAALAFLFLSLLIGLGPMALKKKYADDGTEILQLICFVSGGILFIIGGIIFLTLFFIGLK